MFEPKITKYKSKKIQNHSLKTDRFRHKPVIKKMDNMTVLVNSTVNHSCITLFDDLEAHFTWYKSLNVTNSTDLKGCYHNEEMPDFTRRFCFKSVTDPVRFGLFFSATAVTDLLFFSFLFVINPLRTFKIVGDGNGISILISDRVNHKPILVNKTNDLILEVNQSAELFCTFYSNYFKSVEWQFQKCEKFKENCTLAPTNVKVMVHFILFLLINL